MVFFHCFSNREVKRLLWGHPTNWMVDVYPLMFKSLRESIFTELIKKSHPCRNLSVENCSQTLNILRGILRYNAEDRPTAKEVLDHLLLSKDSCPGKLLDVDDIWIRYMRDIEINSQQIDNVPRVHERGDIEIHIQVNTVKKKKDENVCKGEAVASETKHDIVNITDEEQFVITEKTMENISNHLSALASKNNYVNDQEVCFCDHTSEKEFPDAKDISLNKGKRKKSAIIFEWIRVKCINIKNIFIQKKKGA